MLWTIQASLSAQETRFFDKKEIGSQCINAICQDRSGFLWIATEYGLRRFDGIEFKSYFHHDEDSTSLSDDDVHTLFIDNRQRLWVGTANGIQYYRPENDSFQSVPISDISGIKGYITDIFQRKEGEIRFVSSGMGVYRVDEKAGVACYVKRYDPYKRTLFSYYEDRNGNTWLIKDRGGITRMDTAKGIVRDYMTCCSVRDVIEDADGRFLIATSDSVYVWDRQQDRLLPMHHEESVVRDYSEMWLTASGDVLIGTQGRGLMYIPKGSMKVCAQKELYSPFLNVEKAKVNACLEDRDGNLWVGCNRQGLLMLPRVSVPFHFWDLSDCLSGGVVTALHHDREGYTWCAVEDNGLFLLDQRGKPLRHIDTPRTVSSLYEDSRGVFWVGVDGVGLHLFNKNTGELRLHFAVNGNHPMKSIREDKSGNLYIAVLGEGLWSYHPDTGKKRLITVDQNVSNENLMNYWMTSLLCASDGLFYIGHYGGVSCYDPKKGDFIPMTRTSLLRQSAVYALEEGRDGCIWIGTNKGLFRYNPRSRELMRMTIEQGLTNNIICGLAEDKSGNIWCCTMEGINRVEPSSGRISCYYTGNGWAGRSYSRGVYCLGEDGTVYTAGNLGITSFVPDQIRQTHFDRQLTMTGLFINNSPVTMQTRSGGRPVITEELVDASEFHLSYADNTFTLLFSLMDFREKENISLEYRLEEFGKEWSRTLPGENRIQYHHLSPGDYTLQVRACENGVCSPVKSVQIHIAAPWYLSGIAKCVYILLFLAACFHIYFALKRSRREEINEAKLQFFINISHEIRSPMTLIISPLEKMLKRVNDPESQVMLQTMHRNACRILGLINQLLDVRKIDKGQMHIRYTETDLVAFTHDWVNTFEELAKDKRISLKYKTLTPPPVSVLVWIDRNNFDKVLVNLLTNALKYTPEGGEIEVQVSTGTDEKSRGPLRRYAEIVVTDSGRGIDVKELEKIFDRFYQGKANQVSTPIGFGIGLNLCSMLVKLHHGTITAANRTDGKGSRFVVRIPLGREHLSDEECMQQEAISKPETDPHLIPVGVAEVDRPKTSYKVLVIDDDDELRNFLKSSLSVFYKVDTAVDGAEGWKKAITRQPDIIVSDVMMPEMDGFQLVKTLKSNGNTNHIPIILLTSKTEFADKIRGLDQGADGYIAKPFNVEELEALMANLIANRIRLKGKYSGTQAPDDKVKPVEVQENNKLLMDRMLKIINEHLDDPELNVEMLAKEMYISRTQLHRKMKELTGMSTSDFIRNIRLRQAASLLKEKDVNITQVAYAVGFVSQPHFSTVFKKLYGMSPKEYVEASRESAPEE